jgi:hypothetical protein
MNHLCIGSRTLFHMFHRRDLPRHIMSLETSSNSKTPTHNKLLISKASIYSQIITLSQPIGSLPFGAIALPVSGNYVEDSGLETTANNALYTCINRSIDAILRLAEVNT